MREGLRSSSFKKEDCIIGGSRRIKIPDLNLEDNSNDSENEEGDVNFNGLDECKNMEVENEGKSSGSRNIETSSNIGGERNQIEKVVEPKLSVLDDHKIMEVLSTRLINDDRKVDCVDLEISKVLESNTDSLMESFEKVGVALVSNCDFDEDDRSEKLKSEAKEGRVRLLRSRVVPTNGSVEETESKNIRVLNVKRKRENDALGLESIVLKVESNHFEEDGNVKNVSGNFGREGKRGRPKLSRTHSLGEVARIHEFKDVSRIKNEKLSEKSSLSFENKKKRGRPKKNAESLGEVKAVPIVVEFEKKIVDISEKSVESSLTRRKRGRPKKSINFSEEETSQRRANMTFPKVEDESLPEGQNGDLANNSITKSEKNGKCERPIKSFGTSPILEVNPLVPDKFGAENSSNGEKTPLNDKNTSEKRKRGDTSGSLVAEKNAIRNRIVEMLLSAGWKVEYRPRNGREYNDAVYVNCAGKTHWSVTKAYNTLQREAELNKVGNDDFMFTPLPEEMLSKLFRVVSKTRSDKNVKKKYKRKGVSGDGTHGRRRCALVVRRSNPGSNSGNEMFIAYSGKNSVLAWMIDSGIISIDGKVRYMNSLKSESLLEGIITRDGIHCSCCKEIVSVFEFENHAKSTVFQPYENIYLENGSSLLQCQLDAWNKQDETGGLGFCTACVNDEDPNDDTCAICGDGGDLMCCDGCPSTFHLDCLNIEALPSGEWLCVFCSCKFCWFGKKSKDSKVYSDTICSELITCGLCEEKYHISCINEEDDLHMKSKVPNFCGRNCEQISEQLESLLGAKHDLGDGFSWTLLQRSDVKENSIKMEPQKICNNSKLAVALSIMEECFLPIIDSRSGFDLIHHVVYNCGSNFNRLNFSSYLTVVLEKGEEVISAASIRIRGKKLVEMPFIGTRNVYRRQGMCRRLLAAIEQALSSLKIEKLVIPAIPELIDTWTSVFGFKPLEESVREDIRSMNMLIFAHTDMLQKPILEKPLNSVPSIEKDANSEVSQNNPLDDKAGKIDPKNPEIQNGCLNGKFDLNCLAPNSPDSSSHDNKGELRTIRCENDDDLGMIISQPEILHSDLNRMAENEPLPDKKTHTIISDEVAKSTSNSSGLTNIKGCCMIENHDDQSGDSTAVRRFEEQTLNPNLNLEGNFLENIEILPCNSTSSLTAKRLV